MSKEKPLPAKVKIYIALTIGLFGLLVIMLGVYYAFLSSDKVLHDPSNGLNSAKEHFEIFGLTGDALNSILAPFIGTLAVITTFLAFYVQFQANQDLRNDIKTERFEGRFYELIRLHRTNVNETKYTRYYEGKNDTHLDRKAFQVMFKEFEECLSDVFKYTRHIKEEDFVLEKHRSKLQNIIQFKGLSIDSYTFAKFDLAYSIFFFGAGEEGEKLLRTRYRRNINGPLLFRLVYFIKLKPKRTEKMKSTLKTWSDLRKLPQVEFHQSISDLYEARESDNRVETNRYTSHFSTIKNYTRYYGGHQHRLSHYFRHLYQTYDYLDSSDFLEFNEKYQYGKVLRSQISTYEQLLLFCNSLSMFGWKWELDPDEEANLITDYKLIKNIPGARIKEIKPADIYPELKFERDEHTKG